MTDYDFGDVVLVPFPFTDQTTKKMRPAAVVSSTKYNQKRPDIVLMAITSQTAPPLSFGDLHLVHWNEAGLLKPSLIKPIFASIEKTLILRKLGRIAEGDRRLLQANLEKLLGEDG
jgi:mRNA interferase MazF